MMTWEEIQISLSKNLEKLKEGNYVSINDIPFEKGIYVFYEDDKPIYVGRSNRMKKRLKEHSNPTSTHFSASFAFLIAKQNAVKNIDFDFYLDGKKKTREQLQKDDLFNFNQSKERVSKMKIKVIEIENSNLQAVFEIYASMKLNTVFNKFENH